MSFQKVLFVENGGKRLAREMVNLGVQIRSLETYDDDSMAETPYMSVQYTYTHTYTRVVHSHRVWTSLPSGCIIEYILSRKRTAQVSGRS